MKREKEERRLNRLLNFFIAGREKGEGRVYGEKGGERQ